MMKVLWLCNIMLPSVAGKLGVKASNKEGWLSGISETVKKNKDFELSVAFPVALELDGFHENIDGIDYYGFYEDTAHPENYDDRLEERLTRICEASKPDIIHIFGTEYPHTLAMCKINKDTSKKLLIGIQGILEIYKNHYTDGVPEYVINRATFRDILKKDSIKEQIHKYELRAINEVEAVKIAGNVTGRTEFDKSFALTTNPEVKYHFMNETLRDDFYEGEWKYENCVPHLLFLSQGNYPIKGVHYVLEAVYGLRKKYPDIKVRIAGDSIINHTTFKDKLKLSSYGKYIRELMDKYNLWDNVSYIGNQNAENIKKELLGANIFVCPSTIENSPNSLGEAMLLSVPCITCDAGGITSIFDSRNDGIVYKAGDVDALEQAIDKMFEDISFARECGEHAHNHAAVTHNPKVNYNRLTEIYNTIKDSL